MILTVAVEAGSDILRRALATTLSSRSTRPVALTAGAVSILMIGSVDDLETVAVLASVALLRSASLGLGREAVNVAAAVVAGAILERVEDVRHHVA